MGAPVSVTLAAWTAERRWAPAASTWDPEKEREREAPTPDALLPFTGLHVSTCLLARGEPNESGEKPAVAQESRRKMAVWVLAHLQCF